MSPYFFIQRIAQRQSEPRKDVVRPKFLRARQGIRAAVIGQRGQIVVEYIFLLILSVIVATFLLTQLIGTTGSTDGVIVGLWQSLTQAVAGDFADAP